ncbi:MAG: hypothetical protein LBJ01_06295 [Tannerella sp.]|jgi:hypothetical protein|nr:hypothetical protein [Tannerella sp.]
MNTLIEILNQSVGTFFDATDLFLTSLSGLDLLLGAGSSFAFALVPGTKGTGRGSNIPEGILASVRRWHGGIDSKFGNIDNLVKLVETHQQTWVMPSDLLTPLTDGHNRLQVMINKCRTPQASTADRAQRNALLAFTVGLCLNQVKMWAYGQFFAGVLTTEDIHLLGFLLPGERGGRHDRTEATNELAEVKVTVINGDFIRAVIDRASGENAALVAHGWPPGVRNALIVIISVKSGKVVYSQMTTHLHNTIRMPEGSHGEQFVIKAAFLRHVDDEPRFGNEPTFTMPRTTEDLAASVDRQRHENVDAQMQEIERLRREIERIQAEMKSKL